MNWHRAHHKGNAKSRHDCSSARKSYRDSVKHRIKVLKRIRREDIERRAFARDGWGELGMRSCGNKMRLLTREQAERHAVRCEIKYGVPTATYHCAICGGWHLTTHPWEDE